MSKYLLGVLCGYALVVPLLMHLGPAGFDHSLQAPSAEHWFGTDHFGFDVCVRTAASLRVSLLLGAISATLTTLIGAFIGLLSATFGGRTDRILMRLTDAIGAIPQLIVSVVIVAMFRGSLTAIVLAISLTHWTTVARIVRAAVLPVRESDYVSAAYSAGASRWWVLRKHLAPPALTQCGVAGLMVLPHAVWHESALSFLGLGVPADQPSLGTMLDLARTDVMQGAWWTLVFPAVALLLTSLGLSGLMRRSSPCQAPQLLPVAPGDSALDDLTVTVAGQELVRTTLQLRRGQLLAIIGESGAGKSTLARAFLGVVPADATVTGQIRGGRCAYVPQVAAESFTPVRRIGSQLAEIARVHHCNESVPELLARVQLPAGTGRLYPHELSGGMAQRAAVAAALAMSPEFLVADEPTSALDPALAAEIRALLRTLADDGLGVAVVTHDLGTLDEWADTVIRIEGGQAC